MSLIQDFSKGIWKENAVFKLLLGMCPLLAVTTSAENGLGMGLAPPSFWSVPTSWSPCCVN